MRFQLPFDKTWKSFEPGRYMAETDLQKLEAEVLRIPNLTAVPATPSADPAADVLVLSAHLRAISLYIPYTADETEDSEEDSEEESEEGNISNFLKIVGPGCSAIVDTVASMEEDELFQAFEKETEAEVNNLYSDVYGRILGLLVKMESQGKSDDREGRKESLPDWAADGVVCAVVSDYGGVGRWSAVVSRATKALRDASDGELEG
ncbi:hypothetical protein HDV00_012482 [Rhizophlyctis rosea]|nr:hypothetical protein HDV00_012482 [Rhizophlyctis rosea]